MHHVDRIVPVIRETLGLPELKFDEAGHVDLLFEDSFSGVLSRIDGNNLEFSFYLPGLDINQPHILKAMLAANCLGTSTAAGRLAIDEDKMQALYCERWCLSDVQEDTVPERLIDAVSTAAFWLTEGTNTLLQNDFV
ncbi:Tir chaperone protein (CesT) [Pseudovibrio sp. Ad5]|uniref:type III secretion system chaperone n=1 Tax=Pseudovibrio sp. Ad5 TaxID=989436 RepID=UPI0007AEC12E|nr:type III secretion system chaperone [Pseudovibrio sp. Ad5]KZL01986.1 Tir chaperone protein (CesT) [Pseudovibrio sp. Ad5]